jgi:Uma2 family endonuclease
MAMKLIILDPEDKKQIIRRRQRLGIDTFDEVWNGVYVMSPIADNEHQKLAFDLARAIDEARCGDESMRVYPAVNISDREEKWKKNYRCPDAAVFLEGNPAQDRGTHWFGGPDFAVEVLSPRDRSRKKLAFYAGVGVRELLLIDRKPWALELYRPHGKSMALVGKSTLEASENLVSDVLRMTFRLLPGKPRPRIELTRTGGEQRWLV